MISAVFTLTALAQKDKSAVLLVSDYVVTDGSVDVADAIQKIIDENQPYLDDEAMLSAKVDELNAEILSGIE